MYPAGSSFEAGANEIGCFCPDTSNAILSSISSPAWPIAPHKGKIPNTGIKTEMQEHNKYDNFFWYILSKLHECMAIPRVYIHETRKRSTGDRWPPV